MKIKFIQKTKDNETYWMVERGTLFWKEYLIRISDESSRFYSGFEITAYKEMYGNPLYLNTFLSLEEARETVQQVIDQERAAKEKVLKRLKFDY